MNEKGLVHRITNGPATLLRIKDTLRSGGLTALPSMVVLQILDQEGYHQSHFGGNGFKNETLERLDSHAAGAKLAREMDMERPRVLKEQVAGYLSIDTEAIDRVTIHFSSLTAALDDRAFNQLSNQSMQELGIDPELVRNYSGLTQGKWVLRLGEHRLPISIERAGNIGSSTAVHEDTHVIYRYLHDETRFEPWARDVQTDFRHEARNICTENLWIYLDELAASSLKGNIGAYYQVFKDETHSYFITFKKKLDQLRKPLVENSEVGDAWLLMLFEEVVRANYRARFIDANYQSMLRSKRGEELWSIIAYLTPETGYLIRAFSQDPLEEISLRDLKKWREEYNTGWRHDPELFYAAFEEFISGEFSAS